MTKHGEYRTKQQFGGPSYVLSIRESDGFVIVLVSHQTGGHIAPVFRNSGGVPEIHTKHFED